MKQQSYYKKITRFISSLIVFSYVTMLLISSVAYTYIKISSYNSIKSSQIDYYNKTLNNTVSNINTSINSLYNSGAMRLCHAVKFLNPPEKLNPSLVNIQSFLKANNNNSIFSSFYLIGNLNTTYSLYYESTSNNLKFVDFYYDDFLYKSQSDNLIKHYENIFKFNKEDMIFPPLPTESQQSFDEFTSSIDGKYIYCTLYDSVLCVFVLKDNYFESIFYDSAITDSTLLLKNSLDEVLYSYAPNARVEKLLKQSATINNPEIISSNKLTLSFKPHFRIYLSDIIFIVISLIGLLFSVFLALYSSKKHCDTIFKPYRILFSFFSLLHKSHNFEHFNYNNYSTKNRSGIGKIILTSVIYNVILPFVLFSAIQMLSIYQNTRFYPQKNLEVAHSHQSQQLNSEINSWITSLRNGADSNNTESISNLSYNIVLDDNFNIMHIPFALESSANTSFNKTLSTIKKNYSLNKNAISYIDSDFFGEHAICLPVRNENDTYTLSIHKTPSLDIISAKEMAEYFLTDINNEIIIQSTHVSPQMKSAFINNTASIPYLKHEYTDYGLTLYSFYTHSAIDTIASNAIMISILILLAYLIIMLFFAWTYSLKLIYPFDSILDKMFDVLGHKTNTPFNKTPSTEVEEIFYVYNQMIMHIEDLTNKQIESVRKEDQIELEKTYAILNSLQQQINPHFLYNTLNMINLGLISHENENVLIDIINKLANVFRYSISSARDTVYLCDEICNLSDYIDIWCQRFKGRYHIIWDISPECDETESLKMILQPIVENCFFHAFENHTSKCEISIKAYIDNTSTIVSISDNGCGMSEAQLSDLYSNITSDDAIMKKKHIGLSNIYKRMKLFYGDNMQLDITSKPEHGTTVILKYPYKKL